MDRIIVRRTLVLLDLFFKCNVYNIVKFTSKKLYRRNSIGTSILVVIPTNPCYADVFHSQRSTMSRRIYGCKYEFRQFLNKYLVTERDEREVDGV